MKFNKKIILQHATAFVSAYFIFGAVSHADVLKFNSEELTSDYHNSDNSYARALVQAHEKEFPGAMRYEDIEYYTSLDRLARVQNGVLSQLMVREDYRQHWLQREPLVNLEITVTEDREFRIKEFSFYKWEKLGDWLENYVRYVRNDFYNKFHKFPLNQELLEGLRNHMRATTWTQYEGYDSAQQALALKTAAYIFVSSILEDEPKIKKDDLYDALASLDIAALDILNEPLRYKKYLKRFKTKKQLAPKGEDVLPREEWQKIVGIAYNGLTESLYSERNETLRSGASLMVREVHPNIAILRGYVANDCSTSYSPGFVFTPFDRYYYVFDETGRSLGYVGLSIVSYQGEKSLYIHTIQGPEISSLQTFTLLAAFKKVSAQLGAAHTFLSFDHNINRNVNFEPIRSAMRQSVATEAFLPVEWSDLAYRKVIAKYESTLEYDDPNKNSRGRELKLVDDFVDVKITQKPFELKFLGFEAAASDCAKDLL